MKLKLPPKKVVKNNYEWLYKSKQDNEAYLDRLDAARDSQEEPHEKEDVFYPGQGEPT